MTGLRRLAGRGARAVAGPGVFAGVLVAAAAAAAGLLPPAMDAVSAATVRDTFGRESRQADRELSTGWLGGPLADVAPGADAAAADAAWRATAHRLEAVAAEMDPELRAVVRPADHVTTVEPGPLMSEPGDPIAELSLVVGRDVTRRVRLADGRLPERAPEGEPREVLLSGDVARAAQWTTGEVRRALVGPGVLDVRLVGTFAPVDPSDPFWDHTAGLVSPSYYSTADGDVLAIQAVLPAQDWPTVAALGAVGRTTAWWSVDPGRVAEGDLDALAARTRAFVGDAHHLPGSGETGVVRVSSRLPAFLDALAARDAVARQAFALLVAGPLGALVATLVLAARMVVGRLRPAFRLLAARGADRGQRGLLGAGALAAWVLPGAVVGTVVAAAGRGSVPSAVVLGLVVGLVPVLAAAAGAGARAAHDHGHGRRRVPWLLVGEALVATVAVAVVVAVRRRPDDAAGADPLLVLAPVALGLLAGLAGRRVLPPVLAGLARRTARGRGLVAFLGPARGSRRAGTGVALVAVTLGLAVAVLASSLLVTLRADAWRAARAAVGADVRLTAAVLRPPELDAVRAVPGVRLVAGAAERRGVIASVGASRETLTVVVADAALLREVQVAATGRSDVPAGFSAPPGDDVDEGVGARDEPVPVVASRSAAELLGDDTAVVRGHPLDVRAVTSDRTPLTASSAWVLVDAARAPDLLVTAPAPDLLLVALDARAPEDVAQLLHDAVGRRADVVTPAQLVAARLAAPDVRALEAAAVGSLVVSALLAALAVVMTLALGAGARRALVGVLAALGLRPAAARELAVWEVAPVAVTGLVAGTGAGLAMAWLVVPALDVRRFTGLTERSAAVLDARALATVVLGFAAVTAAATLVGAFAARTAGARGVQDAERVGEAAGGPGGDVDGEDA